MQSRYVLPVVALPYLSMALIPVENRIPRWEQTLSLLAGLALVNLLAGKLVELMAFQRRFLALEGASLSASTRRCQGFKAAC